MDISRTLKQATPVVLSVFAVLGVGATVYMAVKETPEAEEKIKEAQANKHDELSTADKVILYAKGYKKTIGLGVATSACIITSQILNKKNQAALAAAVPLLERSYNEYKDKVKDIFGVEGHQKVVDAMAKDDIKKKVPHRSSSDKYILQSDLLFSEDLAESEVIRTFYDVHSKRYFESTLADVYAALIYLNQSFTTGQPVSLNYWYDLLGIPQIKGGDDVHWYMNGEDSVFFIDIDMHEATIDDMNVIIIDFVYPPEWDRERIANY